MKKLITNTTSTDKTVDGSFSIADYTPLKVKDESIEINCPIKVDGEILEIDLSRLDDNEKKQFYSLLKKIHKSKIWKPEMDEGYFYVSYGSICKTYWQDSRGDNNLYAMDNCFKTQEDALFALEKRTVEVEIKRYIEEYDSVGIDWKDKKQHKHHLVYNSSADRIEARDCVAIMPYGAIYFSSGFNWYKMVTTIGADRIKKYIFGVE